MSNKYLNIKCKKVSETQDILRTAIRKKLFSHPTPTPQPPPPHTHTHLLPIETTSTVYLQLKF